MKNTTKMINPTEIIQKLRNDGILDEVTNDLNRSKNPLELQEIIQEINTLQHKYPWDYSKHWEELPYLNKGMVTIYNVMMEMKWKTSHHEVFWRNHAIKYYLKNHKQSRFVNRLIKKKAINTKSRPYSVRNNNLYYQNRIVPMSYPDFKHLILDIHKNANSHFNEETYYTFIKDYHLDCHQILIDEILQNCQECQNPTIVYHFYHIQCFLRDGYWPEYLSKGALAKLKKCAPLYSLKNNKLTYKNREVIMNRNEQVKLLSVLHRKNHLCTWLVVREAQKHFYFRNMLQVGDKIQKNCLRCITKKTKKAIISRSTGLQSPIL
ncbi:predicted protein [Candida tropicalis MYA-3404]|uniref:Uncharacterized protein n=1 Tax=Candida tropicalis (strain ATCC MYA-3404 / T1) TaxID=294747 RepID=C5M478_CANTT|nr:predicted protein [Candida tropicalis MYA-3404]EER36128.1 predicted protein [Candida tropicalis MYA-3404]KAG4410247.1 hypothetical protein JTP64_000885 [Candida tropicalis]